MPTGNPDTWGEEQVAPKKWGKPSKSTLDNPDIHLPMETVIRTIDTRPEWQKKQEGLNRLSDKVRAKIAQDVVEGKVPPRERYDPLSSDIFGAWSYLEGAAWNKYLFDVDPGVSISEKWTSTEILDKYQYEKLKRIEAGQEKLPKGIYSSPDGNKIRTMEEYKAYGHAARLRYETPEARQERAGFWRNFAGDTLLGFTTYINPFAVAGKIETRLKDIGEFALFSGRSGTDLKTMLQALKSSTILSMRGNSAKYVDPFANKLGTGLVDLKTRITKTKAQLATDKALRDLEYESKINLLFDRELIRADVESLRRAMHAEIGDGAEEVLTRYIQDPTSREMLSRMNPKIPYYAAKFERANLKIATDEKNWKALQNTIKPDDYLFRALSPEARDIMGVKRLPPDLQEIKNAASIARTEKAFYEADQAFLKRTGKHLYNMDSVVAHTTRTELYLESEAAVGMLRTIAQREGVPIKNIPNKGYNTDIPYFTQQGIAITEETARSLKASPGIKPYLQGDTSTLGQTMRGIRWVKDKLLWANAKLTHTTEKIVTYDFPPYWWWNYAGGKIQQFWGGGFEAINPKNTVEFITSASSKTKLAANAKKIFTTTPKGRIITYEDADKIMEAQAWKKVNIGGVVVDDPITAQLSKVGRKGEEEIRWTTLRYALSHFDNEDDAIKYVNKYEGDYNIVIGKGEQMIADNMMFYRWTRFILPLLVDSMVNRPAQMTATWRLASETWKRPEAQIIKQYLPPQLRAGSPIFLGGENSSYANLNLPSNTGAEFLRAANVTYSEGDPRLFMSTPQQRMAYFLKTGNDTYYNEPTNNSISTEAFRSVFGRHLQFGADMTKNEKSLAWKIGVGVFGFKVNRGTELLAYANFLDKTNEKVVNNSIRRISGSFRGCGY